MFCSSACRRASPTSDKSGALYLLTLIRARLPTSCRHPHEKDGSARSSSGLWDWTRCRETLYIAVVLIVGKDTMPIAIVIRYDTIEEFNVDSKAEYSALSSTRSQKKKLKQPTPVPL